MKGAFMHRINDFVVLAFVLLLSLTASNSAAQPLKFTNYQGNLVDADGKPLDGIVTMSFAIYNDSTSGELLWAETHSSVTVVNGLFSVTLSFEEQSVSFNQEPDLFLGITIEDDPEISPRTRLVASPFSLTVGTIDGASGGTVSGKTYFSGQVAIGPNSTNAGNNAFVAGANNSATQDYASVSGGNGNWATGQYSTIGGGFNNTAEGHYSAIGGGKDNVASGQNAVIPGGDKCVAAGNYSIAMGNRAKAWHAGSVVIVANECPL
jgi:hypothetical protein